MARKGQRNVVKLLVNGTPTNILLKLGAMGEVFFVEKTKERVKRHFLTSPCISPEQDSRVGGHIDISEGDNNDIDSAEKWEEKNRNIHTELEYPVAIKIPDTVQDEISNFPQRVRSFSDGCVGSCSGDDSPRTRSGDYSGELTNNVLHFNKAREESLRSTSVQPWDSGSHSFDDTTKKINRERSHSYGEEVNSANENNFMPITKDTRQSSSSKPPPEMRPSPSIWTWAWGTLPSKDEGTPTLPADSSIIFSFCGHVLADTSGRRDLPRTPEEMKTILAKYRLGTNRSRREIIGHESFFNDKDVQSNFTFSEEWLMTFPKAIVDNPRLVIVIDDFILPGIIGFQILMMIYQSKTLNMDSQDIMITRPLTEDEIMTFLKEKCVIDSISLSFFPRWFGRKVSQWDETSNGSISISIPSVTPQNEEVGEKSGMYESQNQESIGGCSASKL